MSDSIFIFQDLQSSESFANHYPHRKHHRRKYHEGLFYFQHGFNCPESTGGTSGIDEYFSSSRRGGVALLDFRNIVVKLITAVPIADRIPAINTNMSAIVKPDDFFCSPPTYVSVEAGIPRSLNTQVHPPLLLMLAQSLLLLLLLLLLYLFLIFSHSNISLTCFVRPFKAMLSRVRLVVSSNELAEVSCRENEEIEYISARHRSNAFTF